MVRGSFGRKALGLLGRRRTYCSLITGLCLVAAVMTLSRYLGPEEPPPGPAKGEEAARDDDLSEVEIAEKGRKPPVAKEDHEETLLDRRPDGTGTVPVAVNRRASNLDGQQASSTAKAAHRQQPPEALDLETGQGQIQQGGERAQGRHRQTDQGWGARRCRFLEAEEDARAREVATLFDDGTRYVPRHRVVHLDLKGAPPRMSYLREILPVVKGAGATALLVEYEDMFPYWGRLKNISAVNAYSLAEVRSLVEWATEVGLLVIPLVQTFGHLEHALKLPEFSHLREVPDYPQSICPSRPGSWDLVEEMVDQVVSLHPDSTWVHVGCDEVFQLALCPLCTEKMIRANVGGGLPQEAAASRGNGHEVTTVVNDQSIFLDHVHRVATYVRDKKGMLPIIWDDMLRKIPLEKLQESGIGGLVEPMVWVYVEDVDRFMYSFMWDTYAQLFPHLWTASAFKGAFGEQLYIVEVGRHVHNNLAWLEVMKRETLLERRRKETPYEQGPREPAEATATWRVDFRGIALTGWSRYDHFAVLCELLPAAIPSLVLNLAILARGGHDDHVAKEAARILRCNPHRASPMTQVELMHNPTQLATGACGFPGAPLLSLLGAVKSQESMLRAAVERVDYQEGWMTEYNARHKFSSPWRVRETMQSVGVGDYMVSTIRTLRDSLAQALGAIYDQYTVAEWLEQHLDPLDKRLSTLLDRARILSEQSLWPRRPLSGLAHGVKVPEVKNRPQSHIKSKSLVNTDSQKRPEGKTLDLNISPLDARQHSEDVIVQPRAQ